MAGCGGILRDQRGTWIQGFMRNMGCSSPINMELSGIFYGLESRFKEDYS
ncbi:ribonuclease H [Senna tora]|uniref:Ribonuclease H n=1 Tax=Senna tora TaxID=362788 RepID=A0A834XGA0_9FABA|nr:ribonuclease H [Senna tora]